MGTMSSEAGSYRRWAWLALVLIVVALLWWTRSADEQDAVPEAQVCEVCGAEASTFVQDEDGRLHAYCAEHGEAARKAEGWPDWPTEKERTEEPLGSQPADAKSAVIGQVDEPDKRTPK